MLKAKTGFAMSRARVSAALSATLGVAPSIVLSIALGIVLSGCMFRDVKKQEAILETYCTFEGKTTSARTQQHPIVTVLARHTDPGSGGRPWTIVDYFVLEKSGPWEFFAPKGEYRIAALDDLNGDMIYQPGEPIVATPEDRVYACDAGVHFQDISLSIPATTARLDTSIDIPSMMAQNIADPGSMTAGQLTAMGQVVSLDDPRFAEEAAVSSLWRPHDAIFKLNPGVYFLEPYDPAKIPVLFVHGINDSPKTFKYLIEHMDRTRYQAWLYSYPSGLHLSGIADHLTQTMSKLRARYKFTQHAVVAHSMGGLVSRGYILRNAVSTRTGKLPLFISISTPFEGHAAAASGIKHAPAVVRVWYDMAPKSDYIESLFAQPLPKGTEHHLLFTFKRKSSSFGESDDETVTVASQMSPRAQREAVRLYGFDDTHMSVLSDPEAAAVVNKLLAQYLTK